MNTDMHYFNYPEGTKIVELFFAATITFRHDKLEQLLDCMQEKKAVSVAEDCMCIFYPDFSETEQDAYGEGVILVIVYSPSADYDSAVGMTYQDFFNFFLTYLSQSKNLFTDENYEKVRKKIMSVSSSLITNG